MGFVKILTVIGRIGIIRELLGAAAAHPARDQAAFGDQINFGQFFCQAQGIANDGKRIAEQNDAYFFRNPG